MASLPKILCVGAEPTAVEALAKSLGAGVECQAVPNHLEAEKLLRTEEFSAVMMLNQDEAGTQPLETIRAAEIVSQIADGVVARSVGGLEGVASPCRALSCLVRAVCDG